MIEYHWDVLFVTWTTMVVVMFTVWGWVVLLLVPGYALYLFCSMERPVIPDTNDGVSPRKRERQQKKNKVVTVRR